MYYRKLLFTVTSVLALSFCLGQEEVVGAAINPDPDEELLKSAKIGTSGASLIAYLRQKAGNDRDLLCLDKLIHQLGDISYKVRSKASARLIALGPCSLRALTRVRFHSSPEVARRVKACVKQINEEFDWGVDLAAVRLLIRAKPAGTVEALLS